MKQRLRVGVMGLGFIGSRHARIFHELPDAELVAVADINEAISAAAAKSFGCTSYTSYQAMLESEKLDAVSITLPDEEHVAAAVFAAAKGLDVLLEKPIAKTAAESREIVRAFEKHSRRLMIAQILHFDPRYAKLKESIASGEIGDIVHLYFKRTNPRMNPARLGGKVSVFYYIGIHDFDMMCACAGAKPVRAYCQMVSKINKGLGCEDTVFALVNFENGALGAVELCWALPNNLALGINTCAEVVGSSGAGYVEIKDQGVCIVTESNIQYPDTLHWPEYNGRIHGDLKEELAHFVSATLSGDPYIVDVENACTAISVIEACRRSIEIGLPIDIV